MKGVRSALGTFVVLALALVGGSNRRSRESASDLAEDRRFERSLLWREALVILLIAALFFARLKFS